MNETLTETISSTNLQSINLDGVKGFATSVLGYVHSAGLSISNFLMKYIPVDKGYIYLALFALISLWLGAKISNPRRSKVWWMIVSGVIMYFLVWWT